MAQKQSLNQILETAGNGSELILYHQAGIAGNNFLLLTYRVIFLMVETMLFGGALLLREHLKVQGAWILYVAFIMGVLINILWNRMCESRQRQMTEFVKKAGGSIERRFPGYSVEKPTRAYWYARVLLNWIMPIILAIAWMAVLL